MAENYLIGMAEEIKSYIPGTSNIEEGDSKITINAELKTGIKGISVAIECAPNTVKIKGTQEYKYPISEESVEEFQQEMMEKYSGCNVYVSGQVFAFSKFFSYQTVEEAVKTTEEIIDAMQDAVVTFENDCVNFLEKDVEAKEEDYNPEENVNLVHVDNAYHAVSTTMQDTEDYEEEHRKFAEKIFCDLAAEIGGTLNGNEVILADEKEKITTDCIFLPLDAEILVSIQKAVDSSPELRSKKQLINSFIAGINDVDDVLNEWNDFVSTEREKELIALIQEEHLKEPETRKFLENAFRDGEIKTTGTDIDSLMPPVSRFGGGRAQKKQGVIDKLKAFFEKFFGIGRAKF